MELIFTIITGAFYLPQYHLWQLKLKSIKESVQMKTKIRKLMSMCGTLFASFAMLVAVNSVANTCVILAYQPDLPSELTKRFIQQKLLLKNTDKESRGSVS